MNRPNAPPPQDGPPRLVFAASLLGLLSLGLLVSPTSADAIFVTRAMQASTVAEVFVEHEAVRVELEIGSADLQAFRNILPDELHARLAEDSRPLQQRSAQFFAEDWLIRADDELLSGELRRVEVRRRVARDEITGQPLPVQPEDSQLVVFAELSYPSAGQPATLSLRPPTGDDENAVAANIGFVLYHLGVPVNDFRYLSQEEQLRLDWDDPWYSRFANRNLWRQFDAPLSAFLYVEPFEVRQEIVLRPKDLEHWVDLGIGDQEVLPASGHEAIKARIADFLRGRNPVHIDGRPAEGRLDRIHFLRRTLRQTGVVAPGEDLDTQSAVLGVIFVYPTKALPSQVEMSWDLFSPRIGSVPCIATDEAGGLPARLTPEDPVLRWTNYLTSPNIPAMLTIAPPPAAARVRIPLLSLGCGIAVLGIALIGLTRRKLGKPQAAIVLLLAILAACCWPLARISFRDPTRSPEAVSEASAEAVLAALLHNVYRAFDYHEESLIYDRLAASIAGDLLSDVYLQTRQSIELENQGGARVKVQQVDVEQTDVTSLADSIGFRAQCRWLVSGSVGHWGHIHQRTLQYEAEFTIRPVDGTWRITQMELLQQERML